MSKIFIAREGCEPLFREGDKFIIVRRETDSDLTPIIAMRLKDKQVYGFNEGELQWKNYSISQDG